MNHYQRLQQKLHLHPAGAPATETFDRILKILFSEFEAGIAAELTFNLMPLAVIAQKTGQNESVLQPALESMADRGLIYAKLDKQGHPRYSLLPTIPGLFEFPFMRLENPALRDELGRLWHQYHQEALGNEFAGSKTPQMRVISVQKSLPITTEVLPYEIVSSMIETAEYIALADCACRTSLGNCNKPREVCLIFGAHGKFLVERNKGRRINQQEALQVLDQAEKEGLVHTCNNSQDEFAVICNCCSCCCTILRGLTALKNPHAFAVSGFVVDYLEADCIGCMACLEDRCPVGAITENGDLAAVEIERCIGCGLCVSVCPTDALQMVRRADAPATPATGRELMGTILMEKGRFESFMKMNQS
ncbi:MAG: indolepyruvate ferredoxin oxidoreductase subunit alpha [Methanobacterium sp.]